MNKRGFFGLESLLLNLWVLVGLVLLVGYLWLRHLGVTNEILVLVMVGILAGILINLFIERTFFAIFGIALFFTAYEGLARLVPQLPISSDFAIFMLSMLLASILSRFSQRFLGVGT